MKKSPDLSTIINTVAKLAKRYVVLIFFIAICGVYGFLTYRINALTQVEPTDEAVAEKLNTISRPKVDQNAIDTMRELEEQNIEVKTLFDDARNNPFNE